MRNHAFGFALDVSKFPAAASRVEISSAIVNRFTAYKVNAETLARRKFLYMVTL